MSETGGVPEASRGDRDWWGANARYWYERTQETLRLLTIANQQIAEDAARLARVEALAEEWDESSDRLYAEARGASRDQAIVLRSKSGTYAVNAERLSAALAPQTENRKAK